ncbi:hypothetical protein C8R44DRAFT_752931 [Mycena epipterygia]|nr:hypothetical protein C8R44DRAFT_752931 [Mycena epipterygia]
MLDRGCMTPNGVLMRGNVVQMVSGAREAMYKEFEASRWLPHQSSTDYVAHRADRALRNFDLDRTFVGVDTYHSNTSTPRARWEPQRLKRNTEHNEVGGERAEDGCDWSWVRGMGFGVHVDAIGFESDVSSRGPRGGRSEDMSWQYRYVTNIGTEEEGAKEELRLGLRIIPATVNIPDHARKLQR